MRGPPGSLARSGLFRGPVASRSPRGRCKGFWVPGPDREPLAQGAIPADQQHSRCLPSWPSGRRRKTTRSVSSYPRTLKPWRGRLLAVLAPSWRSCAAGRTTGHARPLDRTFESWGYRSQQPVGSWKVTPADRHKSREKPSRARTLIPGQRTMLCGHWPYRPRGGVLPVSPDSRTMWREHDEQHIDPVDDVVHGVRSSVTLSAAKRSRRVLPAISKVSSLRLRRRLGKSAIWA
jgi:hypothetical protein